MREHIEEGFMVFVADGEMGVAAVREVREDPSELLINIQNAGDFVIPLTAVRDVHSKKVILDVDRLEAPVREALEHVHDSEYPHYAVADMDAGTPADSDTPAQRH
ncbi:MAG: hypothetical protein KY442_00980 [Proteobacteria bacterium]|nr:hypothetical protein [Pseudomonadota bacterium]